MGDRCNRPRSSGIKARDLVWRTPLVPVLGHSTHGEKWIGTRSGRCAVVIRVSGDDRAARNSRVGAINNVGNSG